MSGRTNRLISMAYRDEAEMLRGRLREIDGALRAKEEHQEEMRAQSERLRVEREEIDRKLRPRRSLPMLDDVRVASPCTEDWSKMEGDDRRRFCGKCELFVYDLSAMTRQEAEWLIARSEGRLCVRFFRRADGTILTSDCPEGVKRRRRRKVAAIAAGVAGAGLIASAAMQSFYGTRTQGSVSHEVMGGIQRAPEPEPPTMGSVAPIADPPKKPGE